MARVALLLLAGVFQAAVAGTPAAKGPEDFPELIYTGIAGAPQLGKPQLIWGGGKPVHTQGSGWAAPAVWDWDQDGKKDLLIGEFNSGFENGHLVGSFVRVYLNVGTDGEPRFTDRFEYAMPLAGSSHDGTPLSVYTWCCIGFTPRFVDLDNDGYKDMISGQYHPGDVTWFRGQSAGFLPGIKLRQAGNSAASDQKLPMTDMGSWFYWFYSSASFGDFDDDGDYDMIVGGPGLRMSENTGTAASPRFAQRELLLDTNGSPLKVSAASTTRTLPAGVSDTVPFAVDWDKDGILDLLVTSGYYKEGLNAVDFFRGVSTGSGRRYEPGKPLFVAKSGGKAFPGSSLRVYVTDWNNDGIDDLLIGASVATVTGGEFAHDLSWKWEEATGIKHLNPGFMPAADLKGLEKEMKKDPKTRENNFYFANGGDPSLVHRGYVYLLLGGGNRIAQADVDYAALEQAMNAPLDYGASDGKGLPRSELRRLEDRHEKNKARLALNFWNRYPGDSRRLAVLRMFIFASGNYAHFLSGFSSAQEAELEQLARLSGNESALKYWRSQPYDSQARNEWVATGNRMVAQLLEAGDTQTQEREEAEWMLFVRDFQRVTTLIGWLPREPPLETAFWNSIVEKSYGEFMYRFDLHADRYADLKILTERAQDYLGGLETFAPVGVAEAGWKHLQEIPDVPKGAGIRALRIQATTQLEELRGRRSVAQTLALQLAGDAPIDMAFTALDGRPVNVSSLRGKVVLIDFWATWCKPCVAEFPHVRAMYEKYKDHGLEVIGISFDKKSDREAVTRIIKEHGVSWPQRFEGLGWFGGDSYIQQYGIERLPTVFLLDRDGRIVDHNARGERLEPLLRKHLGLAESGH